jgi:hypothetical protein
MSFRRWHDESGAVLVHTGIAMIGLLGFSALSVDYGMLWVARRQAQNAADAGALAAAISFAFGDPNDLARVRAVGEAAAKANAVWGEIPSVVAATDVIIGTCPPSTPGDPDMCVRVNVYRNQERGNPMPTFFARLLGINTQGVRATATAQVAQGASSTCIRPWAIPDKWIDRIDNEPVVDVDTWTLEDTFNRYQKVGNAYELLGEPGTLDEYVPATTNSPGSGFTVPDDVGMRVRLKIGDPHDVSIGAGNFLPIALPLPEGPANGGDRYRENIASCNGTTLAVGNVVDTEPGNMIGPTKQGVDDLIAQDPGAVWMCNNGGVAPSTSNCAGYVSTGTSPRLVPVPIFNVQSHMEQVASGTVQANGRFQLQITRLVGFFIERMDGNDVIGRVTYYPSSGGIANGSVDESANFLRKVILVR